MRPSIVPINRFKHVPLTPTAFHSKTQCRVIPRADAHWHFNTLYYPSPHFPPFVNGHLAGKEATPACEMLRLEPFFRDAYIKIFAHISERSRKVVRFSGLVYSFVIVVQFVESKAPNVWR